MGRAPVPFFDTGLAEEAVCPFSTWVTGDTVTAVRRETNAVIPNMKAAIHLTAPSTTREGLSLEILNLAHSLLLKARLGLFFPAESFPAPCQDEHACVPCVQGQVPQGFKARVPVGLRISLPQRVEGTEGIPCGGRGPEESSRVQGRMWERVATEGEPFLLPPGTSPWSA